MKWPEKQGQFVILNMPANIDKQQRLNFGSYLYIYEFTSIEPVSKEENSIEIR